MLILILLIAIVLLLGGAAWYLRWLFPGSDDAEAADVFAGLTDADDDEDTMWFDPRGWAFVNRLLGAKPERLTFRGDGPRRKQG